MKKFIFIFFIFFLIFNSSYSYSDDILLYKTSDNVSVRAFSKYFHEIRSNDNARFIHDYNYVTLTVQSYGFLVTVYNIYSVNNSSQYHYYLYDRGSFLIYLPEHYLDECNEYNEVPVPPLPDDDNYSAKYFGSLYFNTDDKGSISIYFHPINQDEYLLSDYMPRCSDLPDSPPDPNPDCPDVSLTTGVSSHIDDINYLADGATPYMGVVSSVYDKNFGRQSVSSTSLTVYDYGGYFYHWVHLDVPYSVAIDNYFINLYSGGLSWSSCEFNGRCVGSGFTKGYLSNLVYYNPNLSETWSSFQAFLNPACDYDVSLSRSSDSQVSFSGSQHINQTTKYNTICYGSIIDYSPYVESLAFLVSRPDNNTPDSFSVFNENTMFFILDELNKTKSLLTTTPSIALLTLDSFSDIDSFNLSDNSSILSFSPYNFTGSLSLSGSTCFFSSSVLGRDVSISFCNPHIISFLNILGAFIVLISSILFFFIVFK